MATSYPVSASIAFVGVAAALAVGLALLVSPRLPQVATRVTLVGIVAWFAATAVASHANLLLRAGSPPWVVAIPLLVPVLGSVLVLRRRDGTGSLLDVGQEALIAPHMLRVIGVVFLTLAELGFLPVGFATPAGYGDILVALLAVPTLLLVANRSRFADAAVFGWNVIGLADFLGALSTGPAFIPSHLAVVGQPYALNYFTFVPAFAVPVFLLLHLWSLAVLLRTRRTAGTRPANVGLAVPGVVR